MSTIRVTAVDHFVLPVRDLERALGFYRDQLGLPIEFLEDFRAGLRPFVSARVGGILIDLFPAPDHVPPDLSVRFQRHFCLRVAAPLEEVVEQLRAAGVEFIDDRPTERMGATGQGRSVYATDPDGHVVELKED